MTSQLMVESRNDRAENALGLGWYFSKWAVVLAFYYCFMIVSDYDSIFVTSQSRRQNSNPFLFKNKSSSTGTLLNYFRSQVLISVSFLFKKRIFLSVLPRIRKHMVGSVVPKRPILTQSPRGVGILPPRSVL